MSLQYPLINNKTYSWVSIRLQASGPALAGSELIKAIRAVSYKTTVERGDTRGTDRETYGFTAGKVSHESSITFIKEAFDDFVSGIGAGFMDKSITWTLSYKEGSRIDTITIVTAGMKEFGGDHSEGSDALEVVVPFDTIRILKNGVSPTTTTE
jgi:hypothetical protein